MLSKSLKLKNQLREEYQAHLLAHPAADRQRKSGLLMQRLFSRDDFKKSTTVLFFVSLPEEVDTHRMIDEALLLGKRVVAPRCRMQTRELDLYEIRDRKDLVAGVFGLLEPDPAKTQPVTPYEIDLALVPGVLFDKTFNRIGHGAGFYDRFLVRLKPQTPKLGLAYAFQVIEKLPVMAHDVALNDVITEEE